MRLILTLLTSVKLSILRRNYTKKWDIKHLFDTIILCLNYIGTNLFRGTMPQNNFLNKIAARHSPRQDLVGLDNKCLLVSNGVDPNSHYTLYRCVQLCKNFATLFMLINSIQSRQTKSNMTSML